jgi:hypothetical protein
MEINDFDKEKAIEEMRSLRDSIQDRIDSYEAMQEQKGEPSVKINLHEIRYWNKMKFAVEGKEELVEKSVYRVLKQIGGQFQFEYYDEDMQLIGIQKARNIDGVITEVDDGITLFMDSKGKSKEVEETLSKKDEESKTLEELEQEHQEEQKAKENKISKDLSVNSGENNDLKITTYRRITDKVFPREFPETCSGAKEIGMAYSESLGAFILVADYGNGFEIARGTEPARMTMEQVYDIDREKRSVERESPHALMKITGNGNTSQTKEIAIEIGQYGYIETKTVDRAPDNTRTARDVAEEGEIREEQETSLQEQEAIRADGVDASQNRADLVTGEENSHNENMKQHIIDSIMQSHEEELEDLYGDLPNQEAAIRRYIEKAVKEANITEDNIQQFVEGNLEADYGAFFKDRTQH